MYRFGERVWGALAAAFLALVVSLLLIAPVFAQAQGQVDVAGAAGAINPIFANYVGPGVARALGNPTLAYLLLNFGMYALIYEVTHPGAVAPGVFGALAIIVGLFALGTLPVSTAGLVLTVFGFALLTAEVLVVPGSGILAAGGLGSLVVGSFLLWNGSAPGARVAPWALVGVVLVSAGFFIVLGRSVLLVRGRRTRTGREGMLGATATTLTELNPAGQVLVHGEIWQASVSPGFPPVPRGEEVLVVSMEGLRLQVAPNGILPSHPIAVPASHGPSRGRSEVVTGSGTRGEASRKE